MPVAPVAPTTTTPVPTDADAAPADGFAAALQARLPSASSLQTISLGQMLTVLSDAPAMPAPGPAAAPAVSDGWGVATDRAGAPRDAAGPGSAVIAAGERYLGVPYRWGGTDPATGFDCSGFVQQAFADLGIRMPRVSVDQAKTGQPVASLDEAQPGDLVFWRATGGRPNHIGIYAGDGQMLVAPRTGDVVRYQDISRTPDAIRRVID